LLSIYQRKTDGQEAHDMLDAALEFGATATTSSPYGGPSAGNKEGCNTGNWDPNSAPTLEELSRMFPENRLIWKNP
jgi:hypothetical protein